jgi:outer membrane protein
MAVARCAARRGLAATFVRGTWPLLVLAAALGPGPALAQDGASSPSGLQGTIGLGPIVVPEYVGSARMTAFPIPLLSLSYGETFFFDFDHGGVNLWGSEDRTVALSLVAFPRWGHSGSSGPRLAGMARRRDSIEGGPVLSWQTPLADFDLGYVHDLLGASRGGVLRLGASREILARGGLSLDLDLSVERLSARVTDYYFGVRPSEALPTRPAHAGSAGNELSLGISGSYRLTASNSLLFGAGVTRLNHGAASSPIVETRRAGMLWFGYAWAL